MTVDATNTLPVDDLLRNLASVYSAPNLLIIDRQMAPTVDFVTTISRLRSLAKFDSLVYLDSEYDQDTLEPFRGLILVLPCTSSAVEHIRLLQKRFPAKKITAIVQDMTVLFVYSVSAALHGSATFASLTQNPKMDKPFRITANLRLSRWQVAPLAVDTNVLSLEMAYGGLKSYMEEPLEQILQLSDAFVLLLEGSSGTNMLKVKNYFGKGDHSALLINILRGEKTRQYMAANMNPLQQEFYTQKYPGNTDVVVLERNLDIAAAAMSQTTYLGVIDDVFGIELNETMVAETNYSLKDDLYADLKHVNFARVGEKLNRLARYVLEQYRLKDTLGDLAAIRSLVDNLGDLSTKKDLIKKHTTVLEAILNYITRGAVDETPTAEGHKNYRQHEKMLEFQNDVFDAKYAALIATVHRFVTESFDLYAVTTLVVLVSSVHNGILEKDYEQLHRLAFENYGIEVSLLWEAMLARGIFKVLNTGAVGFFGAFPGFGLGSGPTKAADTPRDSTDSKTVGITGGKWTALSNYALVDKFWNLHPVDEDSEIEAPAAKTGSLVDEYPHPSFALAGNSVPLLARLVESLYSRLFLQYKPVNNLSRRPNWSGLQLEAMFAGQTVDINVCDNLDKTRDSAKKEYVVVIVIGGITRGELACFKYLEQQLLRTGHGREFIVLTSGVVNQRRLVDSFRDVR